MCAGVAGTSMDTTMRSILCAVWVCSCLVTSSFSSPAGISPTMTSVLNREDKNELRAVFNLSGILSLQPPKNITQSSPVSFQISALIDLVISPREAFVLRKHIADWDDALIEEREPVFRNDYTLDSQKRGWFKLHRVPEKWDDARERCELEGAELASPFNIQIYQAMTSAMRDVSGVYTGIHSLFSYGDYYSIKGAPLKTMPVKWSPLLSTDKKKRCVALLDDGTIQNVNCDSVWLPYICYKDNNYTPLTECGTTDTEYTFNDQLNSCYKLHSQGKTWADAFKTCSAEGGHLVVINDDGELTAVAQLFSKDANAVQNIQYNIFVGIVNWQYFGHWVTIHGEKLEKSGFSTWAPNEQNNNYNPACGALRRSGLVSVSCDMPLPFVCEKSPTSLITMYQLYNITNPSIDI